VAYSNLLMLFLTSSIFSPRISLSIDFTLGNKTAYDDHPYSIGSATTSVSSEL